MSRDVLTIFRILSGRIYKAAGFFFIHSESNSKYSSVECSKKALLCGDCCDRNQAIILVVSILVSL